LLQDNYLFIQLLYQLQLFGMSSELG